MGGRLIVFVVGAPVVAIACFVVATRYHGAHAAGQALSLLLALGGTFAACFGGSVAVSKKPRENPGFSDFGGLYLGRIPADSATFWTVDHLCTSSRDLDTKIARIDSYKVMLKRS